jgi:hypothetical protein
MNIRGPAYHTLLHIEDAIGSKLPHEQRERISTLLSDLVAEGTLREVRESREAQWDDEEVPA